MMSTTRSEEQHLAVVMSQLTKSYNEDEEIKRQELIRQQPAPSYTEDEEEEEAEAIAYGLVRQPPRKCSCAVEKRCARWMGKWEKGGNHDRKPPM